MNDPYGKYSVVRYAAHYEVIDDTTHECIAQFRSRGKAHKEAKRLANGGEVVYGPRGTDPRLLESIKREQS